MAIFTSVDSNELRAILEEFGLKMPQSFCGIIAGTVNTYYRLDYPNESYFLKIDEIGDQKRLDQEVKILNLLDINKNQLSFLSPYPLPTVKKAHYLAFKGKFVLLFRQIEGKSLKPNQLSEAQHKQIGAFLAAIHQIDTSNYQLNAHRFHKEAIQAKYKAIKPKLLATKKLSHLPIKIENTYHKLNELKPGFSSESLCLIHADLFSENILIKEAKVHGILDFEASGLGHPLFDLMVTLHALSFDKHIFQPKWARNIIKGYFRKFDKKNINLQYLKYFFLESCLRFLITRIIDFELNKTEDNLSETKDFSEYEKRLDQFEPLSEVFKEFF